VNGDIRVGDAEREQAAAVLGEHYAAGRLEHSEYAERLDAIWTARTRADLDVLFADLPRLQPPAPVPRHGRMPLPVVAVLVLVVGALVLTHLPVVALVVAVVLIARVGRFRGGPPRRHRPASRW
jgi:hypothetical protein